MSGKINHDSSKFGRVVDVPFLNEFEVKPNIQFKREQDKNFTYGKIRDVAKAMNIFYGDKDNWKGLNGDKKTEAIGYIKYINDEIDVYNKQCLDSVDRKYANLIGIVNEKNTESTSVSSFIMAQAKKCMRIALNIIGEDTTKDLIRYMKGLGTVDYVHPFKTNISMLDRDNFFNANSVYDVNNDEPSGSDGDLTIEENPESSDAPKLTHEEYKNKIKNIADARPAIPDVYEQKVSSGLQQAMKGNVEFREAVNKFFHNKNQHTHADAELITEAMNNSTSIDKEIPEFFKTFYYTATRDQRDFLRKEFNKPELQCGSAEYYALSMEYLLQYNNLIVPKKG